MIEQKIFGNIYKKMKEEELEIEMNFLLFMFNSVKVPFKPILFILHFFFQKERNYRTLSFSDILSELNYMKHIRVVKSSEIIYLEDERKRKRSRSRSRSRSPKRRREKNGDIPARSPSIPDTPSLHPSMNYSPSFPTENANESQPTVIKNLFQNELDPRLTHPRYNIDKENVIPPIALFQYQICFEFKKTSNLNVWSYL